MQPIDLQKEAICFRWICHALQARRTSSQQAAGPVELTSNNFQLQATEKSFFRSLFGSACCICFLNAARCVDDNWLPAKRLKASNQPESRRKVTTTSHIFEFVSPAPDSAPKTGCFWAEVIEVMVIAAKLIASTKEMTLALRISYWYRGRDIIHPIKSRNSRLCCCTHKEEFYDSLQVIWYMSILYPWFLCIHCFGPSLRPLCRTFESLDAAALILVVQVTGRHL